MRRRMMMGGSAKPYDAEVEWIGTDNGSGCYIDTGVYGTESLHTQLHIMLTNTITAAQQFRIGFVQEGYNRYSITWNGSFDIYPSSGTFYKNFRRVTPVYNQEIVMYHYSRYFEMFMNGNRYVLDIGNIQPYRTNGSIYLFGIDNYYDNTAHLNPAVGHRIIKCIFTENNNILRDFIPVRKNGIGYMYDKVSGQLFGNAGTGQFIIGPDKSSVTIITQQQQHEMYG